MSEVAYVAFDTEVNSLDSSAGIISVALAAFCADGKQLPTVATLFISMWCCGAKRLVGRGIRM